MRARCAVLALGLGLCGLACQSTSPPRIHQVRNADQAPSASPAPQAERPRAHADAQADLLQPIQVEPAPTPASNEVLVCHAPDSIALRARAEAEAEGLWLLDLGSDWVPLLFRSAPGLSHQYEPVFVELANGRFDDGYEGRRAAQERYLEPHGIPPSLALLSRRFAALAGRACVRQLDLTPLQKFKGTLWEEGKEPALAADVVAALQKRLACEQHLRAAPSGVLDAETRRALEEFERRNRIYARASLQGETLAALRMHPLELERRALVRVLLERAVLDLGVIEDGSAYGAMPVRGPKNVEPAPDLLRALEQRIVQVFGLDSVHGAQRFYARFEAALDAPHAAVAIEPLPLPAYYAPDMELWLEIDRGDLYYEFPFDEAGKPLPFDIERGPTMTLYTQQNERVWPLVLYHTTIGGWRIRRENGKVFWQYKESKTGTRAWHRIVTAPVWLPPPATPSETLVATFRRTSDGSEFHALNLNLIGPSFASAYGLVAAYHQRILSRENGELRLGPDDGMRTHGSSDYTSIWRTVSNGCHRLHNHQAMRLLNFVLRHRAHRRVGHVRTSFRTRVSTPGFEDTIDITQTGYEFKLERPMEVHVSPGRIRGALKQPLRTHIPAADDASAWPTLLLTPTGPARPRPAED